MAITRTETCDLLKPILESISNLFTITNVTENIAATAGLDGTYTIFGCKTLWASVGHCVTIDSIQYKIIDLQSNEWIKVTGASIPTSNAFELYNPFYFYGTVLQTSAELKETGNTWDKFPMCYLQEITHEKFNRDILESKDRDSDCDIFFMVDGNPEDWITKDHHRYAIAPMRNLAYEFIQALYNANNVQNFTEYDIYNHAKWGVYVQGKGAVSKYFMDDLSGVHLKITIPFLKQDEECLC